VAADPGTAFVVYYLVNTASPSPPATTDHLGRCANRGAPGEAARTRFVLAKALAPVDRHAAIAAGRDALGAFEALGPARDAGAVRMGASSSSDRRRRRAEGVEGVDQRRQANQRRIGTSGASWG
jgi:hypothetical protein